jgi:selenocysteine-specific elongation factor
MIDLILGTAGHIDHGKTALVKALTGVDTDRLPEEKRRGITIDLGFAELRLGDYRIGVVDVPGHERFVRNMLAGATGIDLALLVVAADDSVMPQTREHCEILRLLQLESGVIAITKCDLVEQAWLEMVENDIRQLVAGTFLADAPLVRTSVTSGLGLAELRSALVQAAQRAARSVRQRRTTGPFRMAVDCAFTIPGHGTVVTGSVSSGCARIGDELAVEPGGINIRVRSLQNFGRPVEEVWRGQRAAINLVGVHRQTLERGQELATPGYLVPSTCLSVQLSLLPWPLHASEQRRPAADREIRPTGPKAPVLRNRARVRLHLGTAEVMASVILTDRNELGPGDTALAQLLLTQPVVSVWGQPFVIRRESPVITIGGGSVLDPAAPRLRRKDTDRRARLADLASTDAATRATAAIEFLAWRRWEPGDLVRAAGIDDVKSVYSQLLDRGDVVELRIGPTRICRVHRAVFEETCRRIEAVVAKMHDRTPVAMGFARSAVARKIPDVGDDGVVDAVLTAMAAAGRIEVGERGVALPGRGVRLSSLQQALIDRLVQVYREAGLQPPTVAQLAAEVGYSPAALAELLAIAIDRNDLVNVSGEYYLHAEAEQRMRRVVAERLANGVGLTTGEIREILSITRKHAIPFCDYLDRIKLTRRQDHLRFLRGE